MTGQEATAPERHEREALEQAVRDTFPLHPGDFKTKYERARDAILSAADDYAAAEVRAAAEIGIAVKNREIAAIDAQIAELKARVGRLLALFSKPDFRGIRFAAVTDEYLKRITGEGETAEAVTPGPEPVTSGREAPGTDERMAIDGHGTLRPVSEFTRGAEKWWCDGEDCDGPGGPDLDVPHVHPMYGPALPVDLLTGRTTTSKPEPGAAS